MSEKPITIRRYWPIMLLAIAMAEHVHAPCMGQSPGSTKPGDSQNQTSTHSSPKNDQTTKGSSDIFLAPNLAKVDPQKIQKKLDELEQSKKPLDPPLPCSPIAGITGGGGTMPDKQQPLDLTPGTGFTPPSSDGGDTQFDPLPRVHLLQIGGGGDDGIFVNPAPTVPTDNSVNVEVTPTAVTSIPEPGSFLLMISAMSLLQRPKSPRRMAAKRGSL